MILQLQAIPKLLLGFIVICGVLIFMYFKNPPTTLCDIQMEEVNARLVKGFFQVDERGTGFEAGIMTAFEKCLESNSPGGCHDMFQRFDYLEGLVKTIPTECGSHVSTQSIANFLAKGLRLLGKIAWGDEKPINKYNKTSWLDTADLGMFCRLKRQYQRLYGKEAWDQFLAGFLPTLPSTDPLTMNERFELSLFSYPCGGLY